MRRSQMVERFADEMQAQLLANAHKGSAWKHETVDVLLARAVGEMGELCMAVHTGDSIDTAEEAADVANFCMFIVELVRERGAAQ